MFFGCKNAPFVLFELGDREGRRTGIKFRKAHQILKRWPEGIRTSGTLSNGDGVADGQPCHPERSEASPCPARQALRGVYPESIRFAQGKLRE